MSQLIENTVDEKVDKNIDSLNKGSKTNKKLSIEEIIYSIVISICMLFNIKGFMIGFILWNLLKNKSKFIYKTGRNVINYSISYFMILLSIGMIVWILFGNSFIRAIIKIFKFFVLIGIYKCIKGKVYVYPLNIKILN